MTHSTNADRGGQHQSPGADRLSPEMESLLEFEHERAASAGHQEEPF